jgi:hypothetical protein
VTSLLQKMVQNLLETVRTVDDNIVTRWKTTYRGRDIQDSMAKHFKLDLNIKEAVFNGKGYTFLARKAVETADHNIVIPLGSK